METEVKKRGPGRPPKVERAQIVETVGASAVSNGIKVIDNVDSLADNTRDQLSGSADLGSTSSRLFPDTFTEANTSEKFTEELNANEDVFKQKEEQPEVAPEQQAQQEDVFDIDSLKGKKFKAIIGGQEQVVPVEELVKGYQTDQYLSQKGNKLYEERKALAEERQRLEQLRSSSQNQDIYQDSVSVNDEYTRALERRLASIEGRLGEIAQGTQTAVYESNQKRLAEELKKDGFDDFFEYIPKMKDYISNLKDDREVMFYDTYTGGKALYHQLKNKELMERLKSNEVSNSPQPVKKPPIVRIDAGSSQGTPIDNKKAQLKEAFERARRTSDSDDWNEYLRLKGVI